MRWIFFLTFLSILAFGAGIGLYNDSLGMGMGWAGGVSAGFFGILAGTYDAWKDRF